MFYQKAILALAPALPATFAFPTHGPTVRSDSVGLNARDGSNDVFNLKGPCADNSKLWASPHAIGGGLPGTESCETHFAAGSDYSPVTGVTAWLKGTGDKIAGIQLTYASGEQSDVVSDYGQQFIIIPRVVLTKQCSMALQTQARTQQVQSRWLLGRLSRIVYCTETETATSWAIYTSRPTRVRRWMLVRALGKPIHLT